MQGVVHDNVYGNIIPSATVTLTNGTSVVSGTGNSRGYYNIGTLISGKCYAVNAVATGFLFSSPTGCQVVS
jgi:hypothetical protein